MTEELINRLIRTKRKTLGLQIMPDASLLVRAPEKTSSETIQKVVRKKLPWIQSKQQLVRANYLPPIKKEFMDGEGFLYLGEWYKFFSVKNSDCSLEFNGTEFILGDALLPEAQKHFVGWYKKQALEIISTRVRHFADSMGAHHAGITITDAAKRWGSCSARGILNFSWRLIMAPTFVVDYVIAHEMTHLEERKHSPKFWQKVSLLIPQYKLARRWLQDNHRLLEV